MQDLTVNLKSPDGTVFQNTTIPNKFTVDEVIADVVNLLSLPYLSSDSGLMRYNLKRLKDRSILEGGKTLREQGVSDGDTLCLLILYVVWPDVLNFPPASLDKNIIVVTLNVLDVNWVGITHFKADDTFSEILSQAIKDHGLLTFNDRLNYPYTYKLGSKALGRYLRLWETLRTAGIPDGDTLTVYREEVAGGPAPKPSIGFEKEVRKEKVIASEPPDNRAVIEKHSIPNSGPREWRDETKAIPTYRRIKLNPRGIKASRPVTVVMPKQSGPRKLKKSLLSVIRTAATRLRNLMFPSQGYYDPVDCTVFAPPVIRRGDVAFIQVFAHQPEEAEAVFGFAVEYDKDAQRRGFKSLEMKVALGSRLTFHLAVPGIEIEDAVQSIVWQGSIETVQFALPIPNNYNSDTVIGNVTVSYDQVPVGHIKFKLVITKARDSVSELSPVGEGHIYQKAFVSYASTDRSEVLKRVQMLKVLRIKVFQDLLNLDPGTRWEKELYRHIDESDLFLLFWSSAAKQSRWVMKEVRYALNRQDGDELAQPEIIPVIIEGPPPVPPPAELAHIHFNDYLIYLISNS